MSKKKISMYFPQRCFKTTERPSLAVCGSHVEKNNFTGLIKKNCSNKSKFSSGFAPFKHDKKNKLSEYFSAHIYNSHFYAKKEMFSMNLPKDASKQQKSLA